MKIKKTILPLIVILMIGVSSAWIMRTAYAVTDTCSGVATEFTATAPASINAGQSFSLTNIQSRPQTSYGVTVNSSTLKLSATNASPTAYNKTNTSTDPSPTTGASTYTAYYPDWDLTASGTAGGQITIKLVEATADVEGYGPITCPLTATLATISINSGGAPAPDQKSTSTQNTNNSTNQSASTDPTSEETTAEDTSNADAETTGSSDNTLNSQTQDFVVYLKDGKGNGIKGVDVTIDDQLTLTSGEDGSVTFPDIRVGEHTLIISHGKQIIEKTVVVSPEKGKNNITVTLKSGLSNIMKLAIGGISILALAGIGYLLYRRYTPKHSKPINNKNPHEPVSDNTKNQNPEVHNYNNETLEQIEQEVNAKHKS